MDKKKDNLKWLLPLIAFVIFIAGWEVLDYVFRIKEIILPNPHEIIIALISNFNHLLNNTLITTLEAVSGFILGSLISICIAVIFSYSCKTKSTFYPYVVAIQAAPMLAFAPLLILWFGNGFLSKVVMAALVSFFPVLVNMVKGLTSVEPSAIELFKSFRATEKQIFLKLKFPHSLKYLFPALKASITFAVVGATIAEFSGASKGIGHVIVNTSYYAETSTLFAALLMISSVGIGLFYLITWIERKAVFWESHD
jgi:NitT/TauT family transport system permease protein